MPGALVADEMGLGKTFTLVAAAMLCKLVTEKVVMGLPLSILWGNTLEEWVILVHNDYPGIVGEERKWYPLLRLKSVPSRLLAMQSTPHHGHPVLISALEPILVVTMPGVAENFKRVIEEMPHGTDFKLVNLLHSENCKSHIRGSELKYWQAGKWMEYPACVVWYLNIQSETIM